MAKIAISLPDELVEELNDELDYGDNRSKWVREAIELRLKQEIESGNRMASGMMAD